LEKSSGGMTDDVVDHVADRNKPLYTQIIFNIFDYTSVKHTVKLTQKRPFLALMKRRL